jgi:multiple sugar transport system substrate-binding protein
MDYLERGGVPARQSVFEQPETRERFPFADALVASWQGGVPEFRPRFSEWSIISPMVQEWGVRILDGNVSVEDGIRRLSETMESTLAASGYHSGEKPRIQ